jgi:hypothetical protein
MKKEVKIFFPWVVLFILGCFLNTSFLFFNEETFVSLCLAIFIYVIFEFLKKTLNFTFFFRTEHLYFCLVYLIRLTEDLNVSLSNLIDVVVLKQFSFFLIQQFSFNLFFNEIFISLRESLRLLVYFLSFYLTNFFYSLLILKNDNFLAEDFEYVDESFLDQQEEDLEGEFIDFILIKS